MQGKREFNFDIFGRYLLSATSADVKVEHPYPNRNQHRGVLG
jgi:hypothetical protein